MKWLIGIAAVMLAAHLYFRHGVRRIAREREAEEGKDGSRRGEDR
jgi:hypothetical protein